MADPAPAVDPVRLLFDELCAKRDALVAKAAPLREQRDALGAEIAKLRQQEVALTDKIIAIEHPELIAINRQIGRLSAALPNNRRILAEAPEPVVTSNA